MTGGGHDAGVPRYELPTYHDSTLYENELLYPDGVPDGTSLGWTAQDYTLCVALGVDDNYAAQALVEEALQRSDRQLFERIRFDSEMGCFFAYADSEADIAALASAVADLVAAGPFPAAIPGGMDASPAFIRTGLLFLP